MKAATLVMFTASLFAADAPKPQPQQPKQASLEEANQLLQMRMIRQQKYAELLQMNAQIDAAEDQIKQRYGIRSACQIDQTGRNFTITEKVGGQDLSRICPDAIVPEAKPEPTHKEEKK